MRCFLACLMCVCDLFLHCQERDLPSEHLPYNLCVCSVFKNESQDLVEWLEYHRMIGVDHFYLYNINSDDNYIDVLDPYLKSGVVSLINWPELYPCTGEDIWMLGSKLTAYEHASKYRSIQETKWLVLLDVNEYLVTQSKENLLEYLRNCTQADAICVSRYAYYTPVSSSSIIRKLKIESRKLLRDPRSKAFFKMTKSIFRPQRHKELLWPSCLSLVKNPQNILNLDERVVRVNGYTSSGGSNDVSEDEEHLTGAFVQKLEGIIYQNRLGRIGD